MFDLDPMIRVDLRGAVSAKVVLADVIASIGCTIYIRDGVIIYVRTPDEQRMIEAPPKTVLLDDAPSLKKSEPAAAQQSTAKSKKSRNKPLPSNPALLTGMHRVVYDTMSANINSRAASVSIKEFYMRHLSDEQRQKWKTSSISVEIARMARCGLLVRWHPPGKRYSTNYYVDVTGA